MAGNANRQGTPLCAGPRQSPTQSPSADSRISHHLFGHSFRPHLPLLWLFLLLALAFTTGLLVTGCEPILALTSDGGEAAGQKPSQGSYLVEASEKKGDYGAFGNPDRPMALCEKEAAEMRTIHPGYTFVCQEDISGGYEDRYGTGYRVGERYFVVGYDDWDKKWRGKLLSKDDMELVIKWGKCVWESRELSPMLHLTDDQDPDDTIERLLRQVPYSPNRIRDTRLLVNRHC